MEQKPQNNEEEKLTPEEKEVQQQIEFSIRGFVDGFLSKTYSVLDWAWPATIVLFIAQQFFRSFGYYGLSIWGVTFFLWAPFAIMISGTALFVGFFYIISLIGAWNHFVAKTILYFKAGFVEAQKKDKQE
jgi:hypothetical protein